LPRWFRLEGDSSGVVGCFETTRMVEVDTPMVEHGVVARFWHSWQFCGGFVTWGLLKAHGRHFQGRFGVFGASEMVKCDDNCGKGQVVH